MVTRDVAAELVSRFPGRHVVVAGDVMLDEYVRGDVVRISPEAPVPVVELTERSVSPGGAANAAANIVSLGARATLVGLAGTDGAGASLRGALRERGIDVDGLVVTGERPTTHKLRVVARTQQIVRVDVESREPLSGRTESELLAALEQLAARAAAFVISDYAKGVVTDAIARAVIAAGESRGLPVVVDPKGRDYRRYAGATLVTPNVLELELASGMVTHNADASVVEAGMRVLPVLEGGALLVTRGALGMTLLRPGADPVHVPTVTRSVFDVTGAGDTVVGTLALALASGADYPLALILASHTAGVAVAGAGTVAVRAPELVESFGAADLGAAC